MDEDTKKKIEELNYKIRKAADGYSSTFILAVLTQFSMELAYHADSKKELKKLYNKAIDRFYDLKKEEEK